MSLARQMELHEQYTAAAVPTSRLVTRALLLAPAPRLALPAPQGAKPQTPSTINVEGRPIKRLMTAEQEERRCLGLCYNCNDKYTRGHNRVCKRLFLLESAIKDDDDAADEPTDKTTTEESPQHSLHAIAGIRVSDTLQFRVTLGASP